MSEEDRTIFEVVLRVQVDDDLDVVDVGKMLDELLSDVPTMNVRIVGLTEIDDGEDEQDVEDEQ